MPRARYTKGPSELQFGENAAAVVFQRGEWREVPQADIGQLTLPDRVAEYGFEVEAAEPPVAQ